MNTLPLSFNSTIKPSIHETSVCADGRDHGGNLTNSQADILLRCRQGICQQLWESYFGEEGQLCVDVEYRLRHDTRQNHTRMSPLGFAQAEIGLS